MKACCFFDRSKSLAVLSDVVFGLLLLSVVVGGVSGGVWAITGILGALLLVGLGWVGAARFPWPMREVAVPTFMFLALMGASCLISIDPVLSAKQIAKMSSIFLPLLLLFAPSLLDAVSLSPKKILWLAVGLGVGLLLLDGVLVKIMIEGGALAPALLAKHNRGLSYSVLFACPLLAGLFLAGQRRAAWALLAVLVVSLFLSRSRATQTGVLIAGCVFVVAHYWPRGTAFLLGGGFLASCSWPFVALHVASTYPELVRKLPDSWMARVNIWDYMSQHLLQKPFLGFGIGVSPKMELIGPRVETYLYLMGPAAHPHNAIIQLWLELGIVGLLLGMGGVLGILYVIIKMPKPLISFSLAALIFSYWLAMVAYSLWTDSLWAVFALTTFVFMVLKRQEIKASLSETGA